MASVSQQNRPIGETLENMGEQAKDVGRKVGEQASSLGSNVADKASDATTTIGEKIGHATDAIGCGMGSLGETIREHSPKQGILHTAGQTIGDKLEAGGHY